MLRRILQKPVEDSWGFYTPSVALPVFSAFTPLPPFSEKIQYLGKHFGQNAFQHTGACALVHSWHILHQNVPNIFFWPSCAGVKFGKCLSGANQKKMTSTLHTETTSP